MARVALVVAYDGKGFFGWQTQPGGNTVQDILEAALSRMAEHPVSTVCAGRTDSGVHGVGQVVHFDVNVDRPVSAWVRGVNSFLPESIAVLHAINVRDDFNARFDAIERRYVYRVVSSAVRHPLWVGRAGWTHRSLDLAAMREAAQMLVGRYDFTSFRAAQCQAATPVREMHEIRVAGSANQVRIEFRGQCVLAAYD